MTGEGMGGGEVKGAVRYSSVIEQFQSAPPGKLFCLHGTRAVFCLSLAAASRALDAGIPMTLVDGTNRFDVYYIADFARRLAGQPQRRRCRTPEEFLRNIFISRAFTCFQMEAVITDRLLPFMRERRSPVVIIFGLLDTFYDEQAPLHEVRASLGRIIAALHRLKAEQISVLLASADLAPASAERRDLFGRLAGAMDRVYRVSEEGERLCVTGEPAARTRHQGRETSHGTNSPHVHDGASAGDGKLVKVPPGPPAGGPAGAR
jgi:hypothetical protein